MEEILLSVGVWGSGEVDPRAASALLNDYLPNTLNAVLRPENVGRGSLRSVINWIEGDDQLGEAGTVGSSDLVRDLLALRDTEGDEVVLVVLWPATPSKEDIAFADSAVAEGIRVLDLCAALDELAVTDEMRAAASPVPEKPRRLTKAQKEEAARLATELKEVRAKEELELEIFKAAEIARGMESRGQEMVVQTEALGIQGMPGLRPEPWVEVGVPLDVIRKIIREEIERAFREFGFDKSRVHVGQEPWIEEPEVAAMFEAPTEKKKAAKAKSKKMSLSALADAVPVTRPGLPLPEDDGTTPFDGPYGETKMEYYEYSGNYRRANGKPRRGEVSVFLTTAEVESRRSQLA